MFGALALTAALATAPSVSRPPVHTQTLAAQTVSLPAPTGLRFSGDKLYWNAVPGAASYQIALWTDPGNVIKVAGTERSNWGYAYLTPGQTYAWHVSATGGPWSGIQVFTVPRPPTLGQQIASYAREFVGDHYAYGGAWPPYFDCSGLTMYVYGHFGRSLPHNSNSQFLMFRRTTAPQPGDLVFFHDNSNLSSYVYHVGIYEGGSYMVAAATPSQGVVYQTWTWGGNTVSFGTITH